MITAGLTNSFKEQLLLGVHDFLNDTFMMALYTSSAELGPNTTVYTPDNEVTGVGYVAGGQPLTGAVVNVSITQGVAYVSFDNPSWNAVTFATRGALIYNLSKGNKSVGVLNFGTDQTMLVQQFSVQLPADNPDTAFIRIG